MHTLRLDSAWTLAAAVATILLGMRLHRAWPALERANIPPSVSAGLLLSVLLTLLRAGGVADVRLAPEPRGVLLLVFFASLGFGAHLGRLAKAGKGALEVGLGGATLGLVLGSLLAGPVAAWLMRGQAGATHPTPQRRPGARTPCPTPATPPRPCAARRSRQTAGCPRCWGCWCAWRRGRG